MRLARAVALIGLVAVAVVGGWVFFDAWPRWSRARAPAPSAATTPPGSAPESRRIHATLFYVAPDGSRLVAVEREVPYGDGVVAQAQRILETQLLPPPAPYLPPAPPGTRLRAVFVTSRGDAFVDLSGEVRSAHPGGSLAERLTVYALVNALTANLPAVTGVQLLVDGREVETLAGHVDLRHPLRENRRLVAAPRSPS
jgi:hypothetical protein